MVTRCLLWLTVTLLAPSLAPASLDGADLSRLKSLRNLLSNGSFEAAAGPRPLAWTPTTRAEYFRVESGEALHGERLIAVDGPALPAGTEIALSQLVPANSRCTYELTAWLNLVADRPGEVGLRLLAQDAQRRTLAREEAWLETRTPGWQKLTLSLLAPPQSAWLTVQAPVLKGSARVLCDAVSLVISAGPRWLPSGPAPGGLLARKLWPNAALLTWESLPSPFLLQYRVAPWPPVRWQALPVLTAPHATLLGLEPDTPYEVRVRLAPTTYYDERGQVTEGPLRPAESPILTFRTPPLQPRRWNQLRLWPTVPLGTFAGEQSNPCVEAYQGRLYVVEQSGGALHLSRVHPAGPRVEWTRQLVGQPPEGWVLAGLVDTALWHDRLYLTYCQQPANGAAGLFARSRQMLAVYDLALDQLVAPPRPLPALQAGAGTWGAGLALFGEQVWAAWLEAWEEGSQRRTRLLVAPVSTPTDTAPLVWTEAPSTYLQTPSLGLFEGQLLAVCSDGAASDQRPGYEPLWAVRCDGTHLHGTQKLADLGRNRYPRGVPWGTDYCLLYRTDVAYPSDNGLYQDLRLTVLGARGLRLDTTAYVDDMTFNTCPDLTVLDNTLYIVYQKYDRAFGDPDHPARSLGTFFGKIETVTGG